MSAAHKSPYKYIPRVAAIAGLIATVLFGASTVLAQRLAIRHYGVSDGLAHTGVRSIYQDAKGYLWFGTNEGVSRFDGYRFNNYSTRDGLANSYVNGITEDRSGRIWVATNGGGVARFLDDPQDTPPLRPGNTGSTVQFSAPHLASDKRIGAETRREVFLIFKEAVNNVVRHSGCAKAEATLQVDHKTLVLVISDDGQGFDPDRCRAGEGLASIRRRAEKIGGEIAVVSKPGEGATIRLCAPLG